MVEDQRRVVARPSQKPDRFGVFMGCEDEVVTPDKRNDYDTSVAHDDSLLLADGVGDFWPYSFYWDEVVAQVYVDTYYDIENRVPSTLTSDPRKRLFFVWTGTSITQSSVTILSPR